MTYKSMNYLISNDLLTVQFRGYMWTKPKLKVTLCVIIVGDIGVNNNVFIHSDRTQKALTSEEVRPLVGERRVAGGGDARRQRQLAQGRAHRAPRGGLSCQPITNSCFTARTN